MAYLSTGERIGIRKGLLEGIKASLEIRFGDEGLNLLPEIEQIQDISVLEAVLEAIKTANSPTALRSIYQ